MKLLPHPDQLHLQAAVGWLELGNHAEANEELEKIQASLRAHPLVLRVRWKVYAKAKRWDGAQEISRTLAEMLPDDASVWLLHATTFYYAGDYQAAYDIAKAKVETFPEDWKLHYDLACYCSRLGKLEDAKTNLHRAMELGDRQKVQLAALDDPDLEALRKGIGGS